MLDSLAYKQVTISTLADAEAIDAALAPLPLLAPVEDDAGNIQAVFRLDHVDGGFVATVPAAVDAADVLSAVAAVSAAAVAAAEAAAAAVPATAVDHAAASAEIITQKLAAVPIRRAEIDVILQTLLGEAASAISFFETYALDPSMTSDQWTAFQGLEQATKDRLLYDVVRSLAALMRYLSGDLPRVA